MSNGTILFIAAALGIGAYAVLRSSPSVPMSTRGEGKARLSERRIEVIAAEERKRGRRLTKGERDKILTAKGL